MLENKKMSAKYEWPNWKRTRHRLLQSSLVFLPADSYPQLNPYDPPKIFSRLWKLIPNTWLCSSPSTDHVYALCWFQFSLQNKRPKTSFQNPRFGYGAMAHENTIEWCRNVLNGMINTNMQRFWQKSARIREHDFLYRGVFQRTYSVFQGGRRLDFDSNSFSGLLAIE